MLLNFDVIIIITSIYIFKATFNNDQTLKRTASYFCRPFCLHVAISYNIYLAHPSLPHFIHVILVTNWSARARDIDGNKRG